MVKTFTSLLSLLILNIISFAQTPVTGIRVSSQTATSSNYTAGGITYNWGQSTDVYLDSVEISGTFYGIGADVYNKSIQFKRVDNPSASGELCQIFVERSSDTELRASYPADVNGDCSMITALSEPIINRGALDIFHNVLDGFEYPNNIERVDLLTSGLVSPATALLDELGFLATEQSGDNDYKAAAILSLDANGEPASYGTLLSVDATSSYGTLGSTYDFRYFKDGINYPEPFNNSTEQIGLSLITFQDLGLSEGQKIYGISFFGSDVLSATHTLTDPNTFPQTTNEGADIHGGLGAIYHTENIILANIVDTDNDGIADGDDIDDDNDGLLDKDECSQVEPSTFSVKNGDTETIKLSTSTDGFTIDISALDNSFNMNINGTLLVPAELQFDVRAHATGESLVRFASDNSAYGQNGNNSVHALNYRNHTPSLISLRLRINANGVVSLQGIRTPSSPLENLIIDAAHPQFNTITWNTSGSNTIVVSQGVLGPTFLYAIANGINCSNDTDGDGLPNYHDLDSDNDGIPEIIEAGGLDGDGDGRADITTDTDGDGLVDTYDNDDTDGPGVSGCDIGLDCNLAASTSLLLDTDANSTNDKSHDNDGDELANWLDLDADGDGILDIIEAGGLDNNGDGLGDNATDEDADGYYDLYDTNAGDGPSSVGTNGIALMTSEIDDGDSDSRPEYIIGSGTSDTDGDDVPDFLDVDSDNDGIFDIYEAQATVGYKPPSGSDDDSDGIDNIYDDDDVIWGGVGAAGLSPINTDSGDGDIIPDYLDSDADGDNIDDRQEAWDVLGGDGLPDGVSGSCDTDSDGDGYVDCFDSNDSDAEIWTTVITPPTDDGAGGSTSSMGINITASNDVGGIFPNNSVAGSSTTEPDWRDPAAPLPVEWLDFDVKQSGQNAQVYWSTASELNADYYEIERSRDGNLFQRIGRETAAGTSSEISSYKHIDQQISQFASKIIYYRIRQVDLNGSFSYSSIVKFKLSDQGSIIWLQPRPVPASDLLTIDYNLFNNSSAELTVFNGVGQSMHIQSITNPTGQIELPVNKWPNGIYYINMSTDQTKLTYKILVKH